MGACALIRPMGTCELLSLLILLETALVETIPVTEMWGGVCGQCLVLALARAVRTSVVCWLSCGTHSTLYIPAVSSVQSIHRLGHTYPPAQERASYLVLQLCAVWRWPHHVWDCDSAPLRHANVWLCDNLNIYSVVRYKYFLWLWNIFRDLILHKVKPDSGQYNSQQYVSTSDMRKTMTMELK